MRQFLTLLCLLPAFASAQGLTTLAPGQTGQKRTNWFLYANTMSVDTAANSPWSLAGSTVTTAAGAPGGGTWAVLDNTGDSNGRIQQGPSWTVASSNIVISINVASASGTGTMTILSNCVAGAAPTSCTCSRSDGGACTSAPLATYCETTTATSTTAVRLAVAQVCPTAQTSGLALIYPSTRGVDTGVAKFSGAQFEVGVTKASKLCVTTDAAKTCTN